MAEQEVIKHFKKSISVWSNDNYTLIKKVKEFLLEIFIIVFAISISIWLHSWEKKHEDHKKVQDFYNDLMVDLTIDSTELSAKLKTNEKTQKELSQLLGLSSKQLDSIERIAQADITFQPSYIIRNNNDANYESFKSSGNIGLIENKAIKKKTIEYYHNYIESLKETESLYNDRLLIINDMVIEEKKNVTIVKDKKIRSALSFINQILISNIQIYSEALLKIKELKAEIKKEIK